MSALSHTTKVAVRKALSALKRTDEIMNADDPMTDAMGAEGMVADSYWHSIRCTVRKAGFNSREQLEAFAVKHRLLKITTDDYMDSQCQQQYDSQANQ